MPPAMIDAGDQGNTVPPGGTALSNAQRNCRTAGERSLERLEAALLAQAQRVEAQEFDLGTERSQALEARVSLPLARNTGWPVGAIFEPQFRDYPMQTREAVISRIRIPGRPLDRSGRARLPARPSTMVARKRANDSLRRASVVFLLGAAFGLAAAMPLKARAQSADTQAPTVPTGLIASPSGNEVTLRWNPSTDNVGVTGYYIYLNDKPLTTTGGTSFVHKGLKNGTTYNYRVSAYDAVPNHSAWTATPVSVKAGAATKDKQAPTVPTGLSGTQSGSDIILKWNPSTDNVGVKGYYVYLNDVPLANTTSTQFTYSGATAGSTNNFRVSAYDAVPNYSAWSAPVAVTATGVADTQAPSVPTGLAAKAVSSSEVQLSWNASNDNVGVKGYNVYLNDAPLTTTTGTSFTHSGLAAGTTYNYRVSAFDAVPNHSAWTAAVSAQPATVADTQPPSVPTGFTATAVSSTEIKLSWNASTDNVGVKGYNVYLNDAPLTTTTGTSYTHSGLTAGGTYNYRVSAFDAVPNHSAWTAAISAKAAVADTQAPSVPTGLTATPVSSSQIKLAWNASTDNVGVTGYYVYLNDAPLTTTTGTSFTHSGLTAGTTYNYRVSAFDAVPNHSAWTATPVSAKTTAGSAQSPYSGTPIPVPSTFEAENFDVGGEGVAYHDATTGNLGGQYRTSENVDIVISSDSIGGGYVINNFTTGEWLSYTVNVATAGVYDIDIRASTTYSTSAFHVEIDGADVTGAITVPNTGSWDTWQWVGKKNVSLPAGKHVLKIHSNQAYFNINQIRVLASGATDTTRPTVSITSPAANAIVSGTINVTASASDNVGVVGVQFKNNGVNLGAEDTSNPFSVSANTTTVPDGAYTLTAVARDAAGNTTTSAPVAITVKNTSTTVPTGGTVTFSCLFPDSWASCGFTEQAKVAGRASILSWGRGGSKAIRLHTEPGDNNVAGSGSNERDDLSSGTSLGDAAQGASFWWAQSVMFPSDYLVPPPSTSSSWNWGAVFGWHHTGSTGQGNFSLLAYPDMQPDSTWPTGLVFRICGGTTVITDAMKCNLTSIGKHVKNVWYDFVYHVKWSSGTDGYVDIWLRMGDETIGRKVVTYRGPTLYTGMAAYLKLANYHTPHGVASSVIHSRVIRGTTWNAVSQTPLEGIQ
jgi:chitodextrinase